MVSGKPRESIWGFNLTVQHRSLRNHLLDMVLSLRKDEEYVCDATLNDLCHLAILVENSAKDEGERIKNRIA